MSRSICNVSFDRAVCICCFGRYYRLGWKSTVSGMSVAVQIVQLLGRSEAATVNHPIPHLGVGLLEIIVDDSPVVGTRQLRVLELVLCLCQSFIQAILSLRTAAPQSTL